jgi:hypothetical protein
MILVGLILIFVAVVLMLRTFFPFGMYLTYGLSIGLGMLYPSVRGFLRKFFTTSTAPPPKD